MGFAAWAREAALRSLGAPAPTRGGVRRQAGGRRRGATRTGETEEGDAQMLSRGEERVRRAGPTRGCRAGGDKSSEPRLNLSRSWQQGHSAAYNNPVPYSSRLQVIHRAGSGNCDRSRLMQYGCAWLSPRGNRFPSGRDSNLDAFSYNPAHGSFAASPFDSSGGYTDGANWWFLSY